MKQVKKILLAILLVALLVSCFAVAGSAEVSMENVDDILEYFEEPVYQNTSCDYASNDDAIADFPELANATIVSTEGGVLKFEPATSTKLAADATEAATYTLSFRFQASYASTTKKIVVAVTYYKEGSTAVNNLLKMETATAGNYAKATAVKIVKDSWYTVNATFTPTVSKETVEGVEVETVTYKVDYSLLDADGDVKISGTDTINSALTKVQIDIQRKGSGQTLTLDEFLFYRGSFPRHAVPYPDGVDEQFKTEVDDKIVELMTFYDTLSNADDKITVLETINRVTSPLIHNYAPTSAAAIAAVERATAELTKVYAEKIIEVANGIDTTKDYATRLAYAEEAGVCAAVIADDYSGENATNVLAAKAAINAEIAALAKNKTDSEAFIVAMTGKTVEIVENMNYGTMKTLYDAVINLDINTTYEGVSQFDSVFAALKKAFENFKALADRYIELVETANDKTKTFSERYAAYLDAAKNLFEDESADGVADAHTVYAALTAEFTPTVEEAKDFLANVEKAKTATYYGAKIKFLDAAFTVIETVEQGYPGVTDAITLYGEMKNELAASEAAVKAYIDAVAAIVDDMDYNAKKAAVENALALQASGALIGYEGVGEANVKLAKAEMEVLSPDGYAKALADYVAAAETATTMKSRRAALLGAIAVRDLADKSFAGVTENLAKLDAAVAAYEAEINAANEAFESAANSAVETATSTIAQEVVATVVAILKKIFVD